MKNAFYYVQHAYIDSSPLFFIFANINESTTLVGSSTRGDRDSTRGGRRGDKGHGVSSGDGNLHEGSSVVSYFYYKEPRHIIKYWPKSMGKNTQL